MGRSRQPGGGQEPLTVVNGNEQLISSEALPTVLEAASVNRIEQSVHLSGVLARFDVMPGQEDWLQAAQRPNSPLRRSLFSDSAAKAHDIIGGRQKAYEATKNEALDMFGRAFGEHVLIDTGLASPEAANELKLADYRRFEGHFRGSGNIRVTRRTSYRSYLGRLIAASRVEAPLPETTQPVNLTAKVSLARMLRPDFQGLRRADYADITPEIKARFSSSELRKHLLNVGSQSPNAIVYIDDPRPVDLSKSPSMSTVVMSPLSIKLARSLPKLAESAKNGSEIKRQGLVGPSADHDAPRRAGVHAVEARKASIEKYQTNVIGSSLQIIDQFTEALNHNAGLARFGSEAIGRQKLVELQTGTIDEMLWAASINMNLTTADRAIMKRSVDQAIYFAPTAAKRRENFGKLLTLTREWRKGQNDLFKTIVLTCNNYIDKHDIEA